MRSPGGGPQVSLSEDEAAYCLASLLAGSDGTVTHAETRRVEAEWLRYTATRGIPAQDARAIAARCRELRATLGAKRLLSACEDALHRAPNAREAVLMAVHVASTDGKIVGAEREQLQRLLTIVGLSIDLDLPERAGTPRQQP